MKGFCLEVSGDFACFTRPEMKVERVSYDIITPSAARGIFTAIFWKPAILWHITKIEVLNPIRWTSIRRNEVSAVANPRSDGILVEDARQQRAGLILRDVRYRLWAENGARGFMTEHEGGRPEISDMYVLKFHLQCRLAEDPALDCGNLVETFMREYYGAGGDGVLARLRFKFLCRTDVRNKREVDEYCIAWRGFPTTAF